MEQESENEMDTASMDSEKESDEDSEADIEQEKDVYIDKLKKRVDYFKKKSKNAYQKNQRLRKAINHMKTNMNQNQSTQLTVNQFMEQCDHFLTPNVSSIVKAQLDKKRYSQHLKDLCLKIYATSGKAYNIYRTLFRLPSRMTLSREMEGFCSKPGLSLQILNMMQEKLKSSSNSKYKYCSILIDEMSLKQHLNYNIKSDEIIGVSSFSTDNLPDSIATHCTTIMAQGLFVNWKQPVGFWFVRSVMKKEHSHDVIKNVLDSLYNHGFIVKVIISDQGSNFASLANFLGVTSQNPYFMHNDQKVFYMYDPPHLLKNTRNCLLNNNIMIDRNDDHIASWTHIKRFFDLDQRKTGLFQKAPKLTDVHMDPTGREKMKVRYAAEVLSATVARAITEQTETKILEESCSFTAEFAANFDQLFDMFNSEISSHEFKVLKSGFCATESQMNFIEKMLQYLDGLKILTKI